MKYSPDIHRRRSIRLKGYDYSQAGLFFITISMKNRLCLFGEIVDDGRGTMHRALNKYGRIAEKEWTKTSEIRPNIRLDEFVIMPNHMHGIIEINEIADGRDTMHCKGTMHRAPTVEQFGKPTSNTIPTIIRGYKSSVTKQINILRNQPGVPVWQRNYYEHIIRNEKSYYQISEYIQTNPLKWQDDQYYV
jgi:putative transposase